MTSLAPRRLDDTTSSSAEAKVGTDDGAGSTVGGPNLIVTDLHAGGRRLVFSEGPVLFGRHRRARVRFDQLARGTSERHAEATLRDARWYLRDLGSRDGTWVGGTVVAGVVEIRDAMRVDFGQDGPAFMLELGRPILPTATSSRLRRGTTAFVALIEMRLRRASRRAVMLALAAIVAVAAVAAWLVAGQGATHDEGRRIAERARQSLYVLMAEDGPRVTAFCTAFAVTHDGGLATNAHCVRLIADRARDGVRVLARRSGSLETFPVVAWKVHPGYRGSPMHDDVGLVLVESGERGLDVVAPLADDSALTRLAAGDAMYTIGFPGAVMNEAQPAADFRAASIARITTPDNSVPRDAGEGRLIWHSALTSGGTSGSPIFDSAGNVIAINSGGVSGREIKYRGQDGKLETETITEGTGLNFGIRIDALRDMLEGRP